MRFKFFIGHFLLASLLMISLTATGKDNSAVPKVDLSIKPLTCIVKKQGEQCQMIITAKWQAIHAIDACLYQGEKSLSCWQQQQNVVQKFNVSMHQDMQFSLKNSQGIVYAHKNVHINSISPKKYRRRLRAEWSLF